MLKGFLRESVGELLSNSSPLRGKCSFNPQSQARRESENVKRESDDFRLSDIRVDGCERQGASRRF